MKFTTCFHKAFILLNSTGTVRQLVDDDFEPQLQRIEEAVQDLMDNNCDSTFLAVHRSLPGFLRTDGEKGK
jgi:hypothetical protein